MSNSIPKKFYLVTNGTSIPTQFSNTANSNDNVPIKALSMCHTGGKDGDYCRIPTCTGESDFANNHISIVGPGINIAFWVNDSKDPLIYYSTDGQHSDDHSIPDSVEWLGASLLIDASSTPIVKFFKFHVS